MLEEFPNLFSGLPNLNQLDLGEKGSKVYPNVLES